jgi:hypothetical protein
MTEEYISGYLSAISAMRSLFTPYLGGVNSFFSLHKDPALDIPDNIRAYVKSCEEWCRLNNIDLDAQCSDMNVEEIDNWETSIPELIKDWTCDNTLAPLKVSQSYFFSEHLVKYLLHFYFFGKDVRVYKLYYGDRDMPWNDFMNDDFVFETADKIYIMHFGEST